MTERRTQVRTFQIVYVCDKCKKGVVAPVDVDLTVTPAMYTYACPNCGTRFNSIERYPKVEYKEEREK